MTQIGTDIDEAASRLRAGGLVGLPTETVYGLAANAGDPLAVARVFAAKGRPTDHPLIVHVAGPEHVDRWARDLPSEVAPLLGRWWPGPLTVLLRRGPRVLDAVTGGRDTVALRAPGHPMALALLRAFAETTEGGALVAPSANRFGRVSPTCAADVVAELDGAVGYVLDGGPCDVGIESTIVDLSGGPGTPPRLLRAGRITPDDLAPHLPGLEVAGPAAPVVAPGMLASHYAPDARLVLLAPDADDDAVADAARPHVSAGRRVGVLAPVVGRVPDGVEVLAPAGDPDAYARVLYARLREADARGLEVVVVVPPAVEGTGVAVLDRLRRAARRG